MVTHIKRMALPLINACLCGGFICQPLRHRWRLLAWAKPRTQLYEPRKPW